MSDSFNERVSARGLTGLSRRDFLRAAAALSVLGLLPGQSAMAIPRTEKELRAILDQLYKTGMVYGDIPSLSSPKYLTMVEASSSLENNEPVFIVPLNDKVYIIPQKVLVWHEVVNEVIKNHAYAITYSPLSGTFAAYDASVRNYNLILDAEGRLFNGNTVLIDRNTGSLWSQALGMCFDGQLVGTGLPILPSYWTRWRFAKEVFRKNGQVLSTPRRSPGRNYGRDPYGSYLIPGNYYDDERILFPMSRLDGRFAAKAPFFGLEIEGALIGIEIDYMRKKKLVNFFGGLVPLLAVHDAALDVVRVYDRRVWLGQNPSLFVLNNGQLTDVQTRSLWNITDGSCTSGNLTGASMRQYFGIYSFWMTWAAFHPETETVPGPSEVPDSALVIGNVG